jgi:HD-GYP domain-containing protein (c-di-GMP phosphodiesterase class II)
MALPGPIASIVRHHHENWDGTGYPDNLRGEAIPIGARVLAIVDCYDALTSARPYRRALPRDRAIAMIVERRGTMYEPAIANAFLRIVERWRTVPGPEGSGTRASWAQSAPRVAGVM